MTIAEMFKATPEEREAYQKRMSAAFDRVKPPQDWKSPIDALVIEDDALKLQDMLDAVEWYTATKATLYEAQGLGMHVYRVTAPGYYAGPAN